MQPPGYFQVFMDGQFRVAARRLDQISDLGPGFPAAQLDALPEDGGVPESGFDHPQQHTDGGRLSGPVQTQEGIDLSFGNPQGESIHGGDISIVFAEVLGFNGQVHNS